MSTPKQSKKMLLSVVGKTPEGRRVCAGVYAFYETRGLPLSDLLFHLWEREAVPDWTQLVLDMFKAGRPFPRCIEAVCSAVSDACYSAEFRDRVIERLQQLQEPES